MKSIFTLFISVILYVLLICGSDGCSSPTGPSGSNGNNNSGDSLIYHLDSIYISDTSGIYTILYSTLFNCTFKTVHVIFNSSTNCNIYSSTPSFHIINSSTYILSGIELAGRNINYQCDTILTVSDSLPHALNIYIFASFVNANPTYWIEVNNLKIYKHS